ncbi:MAG: hypothetical protein MRY83_03740 [Flavobacteriales bacterium]|nr:hypothetical protein [Flavobacteriales bacterium]
MKILMLFISWFLMIQMTCNKDVLKKVEGCWKHSYEEDTGDGIKVYRPCDYKKWPASRFRHFIEFNENGTHKYLWLSPIDAHRAKEGKWSINKDLTELTLTDAEGKSQLIKIIAFEEDLLKIQEVRN